VVISTQSMYVDRDQLTHIDPSDSLSSVHFVKPLTDLNKSISKIVDQVASVNQIIPLNAKTLTDSDLTRDLIQYASSVKELICKMRLITKVDEVMIDSDDSIQHDDDAKMNVVCKLVTDPDAQNDCKKLMRFVSIDDLNEIKMQSITSVNHFDSAGSHVLHFVNDKGEVDQVVLPLFLTYFSSVLYVICFFVIQYYKIFNYRLQNDSTTQKVQDLNKDTFKVSDPTHLRCGVVVQQKKDVLALRKPISQGVSSEPWKCDVHMKNQYFVRARFRGCG